MDILELYKIQEEKEKKKILIYKDVLNKCCDKILRLSKSGRTDFYYQIPVISYGLPLFDVEACMCYLIYKFKKKGFKTKYIYPSGIYISWKKEEEELPNLLI